MSKRKKTSFPDELFVAVSVDRMNPEDGFESEPMAREMAEKNTMTLQAMGSGGHRKIKIVFNTMSSGHLV